MLVGERAGRGSGLHTKLVEDVAHVTGNGVLADAERGRDLPIGLTRSHERKHFSFTVRQRA